jgi:YhcH/YjgK/YiaL family protein
MNYSTAHPGFEAAFKFLRKLGPVELKAGRCEIDGSRLYAVVVKGKGKGKTGTRLETHDQYIDVQYSLSGSDVVGWERRAACGGCSQGYDMAKDLEFYSNPVTKWVDIPERCFGIFFPEDAHAPLGTDGEVYKVVVKVAVDWVMGGA